MYFHVIGIKEVDNQKYNINVILEAENLSIAKDFLHQKNIITLDINQYKNSIDNFGNIEFFLRDSQVFKFFYSGQNLLESIKYFLKLDFPISYANFLSSDKLPDSEVFVMIQQANTELAELDELIKQEVKQKKIQTSKIFKDERLIKVTQIANDTIIYIDQFLTNIDLEQISADKTRDLRLYYQDLNKLKMSRNLDKMIEVLSVIYQKIYNIQKEYLSKQNPSFIFPGSVVTDLDLILEYYKYQKAQKVKQIGSKRDRDDVFYLSFEKTGLFSKLLGKDIKNFLQNIPKNFYKIFDYIDFFFVFFMITFSFYLWFNKISYSTYINNYIYYSMIKVGIFAFVFSIFKVYKKNKLQFNIAIIVGFIIISQFLFWLIKNNLSF